LKSGVAGEGDRYRYTPSDVVTNIHVFKLPLEKLAQWNTPLTGVNVEKPNTLTREATTRLNKTLEFPSVVPNVYNTSTAISSSQRISLSARNKTPN
jgi:hypothetical protein